MTRLWDKGIDLNEQILNFTAGEDHQWDERLVAFDIEGSLGHLETLKCAGHLSAADADTLAHCLRAIGASHQAGEWRISLAEEDSQTAIENRLTERLGALGGRIHLGRSRNDQVLTALRLYLLAETQQLARKVRLSVAALQRLSARQGQLALPGYTHMQQAMPSSVALWAEGYASELSDDADGIAHVRRRLSKCPLGSAAGYGTPGVTLSRAVAAQFLGFDAPHEPVTAVQLSRGKAEAQLLFELHLTLNDTARLSQDLLLFYTQEFAFVRLPVAMTTGSSIMPQKRNPDVFELMRARAASSLGYLVEALGVFARLPSGYQRDLQLLKAPLFRGIDLANAVLDILPTALDGVEFCADKIRLDPSIHAAEQANRLAVTDNIPFRDAYRTIAKDLAKDL
jgi:argininosuccinate lyase